MFRSLAQRYGHISPCAMLPEDPKNYGTVSG